MLVLGGTGDYLKFRLLFCAVKESDDCAFLELTKSINVAVLLPPSPVLGILYF